MLRERRSNIVSYIVICCTFLFLLLLISFPFDSTLVSLGIYLGWLVILCLPTYIALLIAIRRTVKRERFKLDFSFAFLKSLLGYLESLFKVALIQLLHIFGFLFLFRKSLVVQGLLRISFSEIKLIPEKTLVLISKWLSTLDWSPSGVFMAPLLFALISYVIITIPVLYFSIGMILRINRRTR